MAKTLPTPAAPGEKSTSYEPALDIIRFFAFFAVFLPILFTRVEMQYKSSQAIGGTQISYRGLLNLADKA